MSKDKKSSLDELLKADLDFHRAIYAASGNKLIVTVAEFVLNMVAPWVRKSLDVSGRYRAVSLHEQIYDMIEKRKAGSAARESVDVNLKHFQASLEALKNGTVNLDAERNHPDSIERRKMGSTKN